MKVSVKAGQITLLDTAEGINALIVALQALDGHALSLQVRSAGCVVLEDLGPREAACREPINITRSVDRRYAAISNLHPTPFLLDDEVYGSVEGFWQSLKCETPARRRQIAVLSGPEAKKAAGHSPPPATLDYRGDSIRTGTHAHWALMERACTAKFSQDLLARKALLATGTRPLTHIVREDSRTIPGVIMAAIWMRIREQLRAETEP